MRRVVRAAGIACLAASLACAQTVSFLKGVLLDRSGAGVPGADCILAERRIGRVFSATSWTDGSFHFTDVLAGSYDLKIRASGFRVLVTTVELRVSETVEVRLVLEVGPVADSIEVRPEPPMIDTASSTHSQVIDQRRMLDLPLAGGNPVELALLTTGMVTNRPMTTPLKAPYTGTAISADGSPSFTNEFQLDGVSNTFADGSAQARDGFRPPPTAIQEFKIQTTPYDASVGHSMGAAIFLVSAAGTNQLHGEAHYWLRNSAFDAPNFFNNKNNTKVSSYRDSRYGASAGGPVVFPRVYNGTNRTFWYHAWESNQWSDPQYFTSTVPSAAERQGDFSELLKLGGSYQIYDPATTKAMGDGHYVRTPFAGNVIPSSRLDKVGSNLAALWPLPNQSGSAGGQDNFYNQSSTKEDYYVHVSRVDHAFTDSHRLFVRVNYDHWVEGQNDFFKDERSKLYLMRINRGLAMDDVFVINPTLVLNVRYGISNQEFPEYRSSRGYNLASLGFSSQLTGLIDSKLATIPQFTAGEFSTYSDWGSGDGTNTGLTHTLAASLTKLHGSHNLKIGGDTRLYRAFGARYPYSVSPSFSYWNDYTRGPYDSSSYAPIGQELASMLLSIPDGLMSVSASSALQDRYLGLFVHDDFKVTSRLTLNLGLRYELESPLTERYNRLVAGFAYGETNPISDKALANYAAHPIDGIPASSFRVTGGQTYLNERGVGRSPFRGEKNNFLPRVGFAYQLFPRTTLRGGYGIYYDSIGVNAQVANQTGFSQVTPIQSSLDNGLTFLATNANPFPNGLKAPAGASGGLKTNLGQSLTFYDYDLKQPYSQRWSFGFQQLLPGAWLLDAAYVANRATRLQVSRSLNETPAQYLSTSPLRDQATINYLSASYASPFYGTDAIYGKTITRGDMLKPYPEFGSITVRQPIGYSWYHSLQTRMEKRFSQGYTMQFSYTWSKLMTATEFLNACDPRPYEVIGTFDRRHRFTSSGIWEVPVGRGRHFGGQMPAVLNFVVGGWQLGGIVTGQSGAPLAFGNISFVGNTDDIQLPSDQRSVSQWFNVNAGFLRGSSQKLSYNYRSFPLRFSGLRGGMLSRWDFSLIKDFTIHEKVTFQFRTEVFNAWNHPSFSSPNMTPTSSAFGSISSTTTQARQWQFSGRIKF